MHIINRTRGVALAREVRLADTWCARFKGLMGKKKINPGEGLVLVPCNSVHTCFMRFAIDVVFVNAYGRVLKLYHALAPYRLTVIVKGAAQVIELPAGTVRQSGTQVGDLVELE